MERGRVRGFVRRIESSRLKELAAGLHMHPNEAETEELTQLLNGSLAFVDRMDDLPEPVHRMKYTDRDPGYRPGVDEDPLNLFIRKCRVQGAAAGPLAGKRVALKDNIAVAGIPMTHGSRAFVGVIPDFDAIVVERLLDAGAVIVGKLNQDDFAASGSSDTSVFGPARNPVDPRYSPGGSSAATGAAVVSGAVDIAIGQDGAGSGRIPAAWTGACSIKATLGLVPQFGLVYQDFSQETMVPITRTIPELAEALQVIAGPDDRDPHAYPAHAVTCDYLSSLNAGAAGLRIGLVEESFGWPDSEADVDAAVRATSATWEQLGASVRKVSVPLWREAWPIMAVFLAHSYSAMLESDDQGYFHMGACSPSFAETYGKIRRTRADEFPALIKLLLLLGKYLREDYFSVYFAKATNLRRMMRDQIDEVFRDVDVLVTPTTPTKAILLTETPLTTIEWSTRAASNILNTTPLNVTGHPALQMPCGVGEHDLPIGMQLVGPYFSEALLLRAAAAFAGDEE